MVLDKTLEFLVAAKNSKHKRLVVEHFDALGVLQIFLKYI